MCGKSEQTCQILTLSYLHALHLRDYDIYSLKKKLKLINDRNWQASASDTILDSKLTICVRKCLESYKSSDPNVHVSAIV